jgi:hypothetical protein
MPTSPEIISNTEHKGYSIVRLSKDNLHDLASLYSEVYGHPVPHDYFPKKYDTAFTGVQYVGFIAYNREKLPVAYYGVIPCFLQYEDKIIVSAQSADTMTHPMHRHKGLFVELSKMTFALCRDLGIGLVYGFPNQNFYLAAMNKLDWKETESLDCFIIPVKGLRFESFSNRLPFLKGAYKAYTRVILKKYLLPIQGISNSVISDGYGGVYRDDRYFHYKTYSQTSVMEIGQSRVWFKIRNGFIIGDLAGADEKIFQVLMEKIKKIARRIGVNKIYFHVSRNTRLHALFAALYPATHSFPVIFQDFDSGIPIEKIKFTFSDIDIF